MALCAVYAAVWGWSIYLSAHDPAALMPVLPEDSTEYAQLAKSLETRNSFTNSRGQDETFRTPGYPMFVAVAQTPFGGSFFAVTFAQLVLAAVTALLVRKIGARLFSPLVGDIAGLAFMANPLTLALAIFIASDIPFIFLYALFWWIVVCWRPRGKAWPVVLAAGLVCAASAYVRPIGFWELPIFLAPIAAARLTLRQACIWSASILAIALLCVSPWVLRNKQATGVASFSSLSPYNIVYYNIPMYLASRQGTSTAAEKQGIAESTGVPIGEWRDLRSAAPLNRYVIEFIKNHFLDYSKYHVITSVPMFFTSDIEQSAYLYSVSVRAPFQSSKSVIFGLESGHFGGLSAIFHPWWKFAERLFLCFCWIMILCELWTERKKPAVWAVLFVILYIFLMTGPLANARYRLPADPFIYLLAAAGLVRNIQYLYTKKLPSATKPAAMT